MHTQGPWKIVEQQNLYGIVGVNEDYIALQSKGESVTTKNKTTSEIKANAYLIAAAPDMLEAIELMLETLGPDKHKYDFPIQRAYDKLVLAKGKALEEQQ